jgi:prevent-host-death family protein
LFQATFNSKELPDPVELINGGREERDDMILNAANKELRKARTEETMKKTVSATEARVHFGELLREVAEEGTTYVVERGGKPQAVMISTQEYERFQAVKPRVDWVAQYRRSQEMFRPLNESGKLNDIEEVIREEREKRDQHLLDLLR